MRFLKSFPVFISLGLIAGSLSSPALAGSSQSYKVELNKTEIVRLPGAAASVIIGNPKIADVGVRLYNGKSRETYSCIPYCGPSPVLGDDTGFIGDNTSQEEELTNFTAFSSSQSTSSSNQFDYNSQTTAGAPTRAN